MFSISIKFYGDKGTTPEVKTLKGSYRLDEAVRRAHEGKVKFSELGINCKFVLTQVPGSKIH